MSDLIGTDDCRDWPEDFSRENGNYLCHCVRCGAPFVGHKRRVVCRLCSEVNFMAGHGV